MHKYITFDLPRINGMFLYNNDDGSALIQISNSEVSYKRFD